MSLKWIAITCFVLLLVTSVAFADERWRAYMVTFQIVQVTHPDSVNYNMGMMQAPSMKACWDRIKQAPPPQGWATTCVQGKFEHTHV